MSTAGRRPDVDAARPVVADGPFYRPVANAVLLRASVCDHTVVPTWWPAPDADSDQWRSWLIAAVASPDDGRPDVLAAIAHASPELAAQVESICRGQAVSVPRARRAAEAVARYLLRARGRATPCGLFAGVAPLTLGPAAAVWGTDHRPHVTPAPADLAAAVASAEGDPTRLRRLRVHVNDLTSRHGGRLLVDGMPHLHRDHPAEVSVRFSDAVALVLAAAARPVSFPDLVRTVADRLPGTPRGDVAAVEVMVTQLVRHGVLVSELRVPGTCSAPAAVLHGRVDFPASTRPPSIDLRVDAVVTVPHHVLDEVAEAARLLVVTAADTPGRRSWRAWHRRFLDRFGPGAAVPVTAAVDPVAEIGWPEHLQPGHLREPSPGGRRDRHLTALMLRAARSGADEIDLTAADVAALGRDTDQAGTVPHLSLCVQVHCADRAALDAGRFAIVIGAVAPSAAALGGRLLDWLPAEEAAAAVAALGKVPSAVHGATVVQLSAPPLPLDCDPLGRVPRITDEVLRVGEFGDDGLRVADLRVVADRWRLYLIDRGGQLIEPLTVNTLAGHTLPPLVRFLAGVTTATLAPVRGFDWGPHAGSAWRPRVRAGRIILSPAAWRLHPADLSGPDATATAWQKALTCWRDRERVPRWMYLGDSDHRLRLDLTAALDAHQLRLHLAAGPVTLTEAADDTVWGWIGGHAHELAVPLVSTAAPAPRPAVADRAVRVTGREASLPVAGPVLSALISCDPRAMTTIVTEQLPALVETLTAATGAAPELWWLPMRQPTSHLRLRVITNDPVAAGLISGWVAGLRRDGLAGPLTFDTFHPEIGRYGAGAHDPAAAMRAVYTVWTTDSAVAATLLTITRQAPDLDTVIDIDAATAASLLDLACAALGRSDGFQWLLDRRDLTGTAPLRDRASVQRARALWADPPPALAQAWTERAHALTGYRRHLGDATASVLSSLLHLHHVRIHQPDPTSEQVRHRIARAVALSEHNARRPT